MSAIDRETRNWIRNEADERAARNGCRFEAERAAHVCDFFPKFLKIYEGEKAGRPFELMDWQRECLSSIFGWVQHSDFVGRDVRRFRKACIYVPKKNGKSPLAAGVGLYLLAADGEQGQKVFSAARDGKQAGIIHTHAKKMVEVSRELSAVCKINRSTGRIVHVPTSSFYDILSGDNIKGQEGLNGSVVIDETHVVDSRLASVIEHMGASRAEPLQFEVSTAGSDPQGYGRRQYEYGREVNAGRYPDDRFFFRCFEAPQDASDEALADPEIWKNANPSWGVTISPEEFADSFSRAKRSLHDWTTFKMYRLNIWANSANPFIREPDWTACRDQFSEEDVKGRSCVIGLDLARKQDLTAAAFVFGPEDSGEMRVLCRFWMPEDRAKMLAGQVPYLEWARDGHVTLTPGNVCDYSIVQRDILETCRDLSVREIVFDPLFAEDLTRQLSDATGAARCEFAQTSTRFAKPTADFESLVLAHKLRHDGHPILSWQVGHAMVREMNGIIRPVRPNRNDTRTIDGVVAMIMAIGVAVEQSGPSAYETPGSLSIWNDSDSATSAEHAIIDGADWY